MSLESAVGFYERLAAEPDLQERIRELETPDRIESYVKGELGYDFTKADNGHIGTEISHIFYNVRGENHGFFFSYFFDDISDFNDLIGVKAVGWFVKD